MLEKLLPEFLAWHELVDLCKALFVAVLLTLVVVLLLGGSMWLLGADLCKHQYVPTRSGDVVVCMKCAKAVKIEVKGSGVE